MAVQRVGPLAWGQYFPWVAQETSAFDLSRLIVQLTFTCAKPESIDVILPAIDALVAGAEALRSTFHYDDQAHVPVQRVHNLSDHAYDLRIVHRDGSTSDLGITTWLFRPFDLEREWPFRVVVVAEDGAVPMVRLAVHHVVLDHHGRDSVTARLAAAIAAVRCGTVPEPLADTDHPLDVSAFESTDDGQYQQRRSLAYWSTVLRRIPGSFFHAVRLAQADDSTYRVQRQSSLLYQSVGALADRCRTSPAVLMSAVGLLALGWVAAREDLDVSLVSSNRMRPSLRRAVDALADRGMLAVSVDDGLSFTEWLARVQAASLKAYRYSYYDPTELRRLVTQTGRERGIRIRRTPTVSVIVEDVTDPAGAAASDVATERADVKPGPFDSLHYRVTLGQRVLLVEIVWGSHLLSLAAGQEMLRLCTELIGALSHDHDRTLAELRRELAPVARPLTAGLCRCGSDMVDVAAIGAALEADSVVMAAAVFVDRDRLVGFAVPTEEGVTPEDLRRRLYESMPDVSSLRAPDWLVLCASPPADRSNLSAWRACGVLGEGSGWPLPPLPPGTAAEVAVARALAESHPGVEEESVDVGSPYLVAGGRFERLPEFLRRLDGLGYRGASADEFLGWRSLAGVMSRRVGEGSTAVLPHA